MPGNFVDYYELMQISPNAEPGTISRVYKLLAQRYHPDNPTTGNLEKFLLLKRGFETLTDPNKRSLYDSQHQIQIEKPIEVFGSEEFVDGVEGERNRRLGVLCLLYHKRRSNPDKPGISVLDLEALTAIPREHLAFPLWYLKEKGFVRQDDSSSYVVTADGVDHIELALPSNTILHRLLKAADSGRSPGASASDREPRQGQNSANHDDRRGASVA
jgi:curved DNA-binding protein CbpA